jgi:HTH-type transcriptional regulator/antitoxin HigA
MSKTDESTRDEIAANQRAAAWLIPPRAFERFVKSQHPYFSERAILAFAGNIRRHPGIVLGRLQRAGLVPYRNLRKLLPRVSSYLAI